MSLIDRDFLMRYLYFLLHIGTLGNIPVFVFGKTQREVCVLPGATLKLSDFRLYRHPGYVPFRIEFTYSGECDCPECQADDVMSGLELITDRRVAWRYFPVFLQLFKTFECILGKELASEIFS